MLDFNRVQLIKVYPGTVSGRSCFSFQTNHNNSKTLSSAVLLHNSSNVSRSMQAALLAPLEEEAGRVGGPDERKPAGGGVPDFPPPAGREILLRTCVPRPAPYSKALPQRLFCVLMKEDFRLAGAFSSDTSFFWGEPLEEPRWKLRTPTLLAYSTSLVFFFFWQSCLELMKKQGRRRIKAMGSLLVGRLVSRSLPLGNRTSECHDHLWSMLKTCSDGFSHTSVISACQLPYIFAAFTFLNYAKGKDIEAVMCGKYFFVKKNNNNKRRLLYVMCRLK